MSQLGEEVSTEMSNTEYTLGIDFGTCFSFPAAVIDNNPKSLLRNEGSIGIPTCFYYDRISGELFGEDAERLGKLNEKNSKNCIWNIKSDILSISVDDINKSYVLDGKSYPLITVCARILRKIVDEAEEQIREDEGDDSITFQKAVISIPVKAGVVQKSILLSASQIPRNKGGPGLKKVGFIQEPVAAALCYAKQKKVSGDNILVYDLGGGTFDVTLIKPSVNGPSPYEVIESMGASIGGNDFDQLLANYCAKKIQRYDSNSSISSDNRELIESAKKAKEQLSNNDGATVECHNHLGVRKTCDVTKDDFEKLIAKKVEETVEITFGLANKYSLIDGNKLNDNVRVVMVGGSSQIPFIKNELKKRLKINNIPTFQPWAAIALGDAIFADNTRSIKTVSQYSYGRGKTLIDSYGVPLLKNVILKGVELPYDSGWISEWTSHDNQEGASLLFYENEYLRPKLNFMDVESNLGEPKLELEINFGKPVPEGTEVKYSLSLSSDNLLSVRAKYVDPDTGKDSAVRKAEIRLIN